MLSRVADSIYWMNRYIERAENSARYLEVIQQLVLDLPHEDGPNQWAALIAVSGDRDSFYARYDLAKQSTVFDFLTLDAENPNSMLCSLFQARENARSIREAIPSEMWEQINRTYLMLRDAVRTQRHLDEPAVFLSHVRKACVLIYGMADATMTHNEGWHFARMGRLLERADKTSRMIDVKYFMLLPEVEYVGSPYDAIQWSALLKCISAFEMYRKQYHDITPINVVAFLILDRLFPRSIRYCLVKAEESLHAITGSLSGTFGNGAEQRLGRLRSELDYAHVEEIIHAGLHEFLDQFQGKLNKVDDAIFEAFFAHKPQELLTLDTRVRA